MRFPVVKLIEDGCECWNMMLTGLDDCIRDPGPEHTCICIHAYVPLWNHLSCVARSALGLVLSGLLLHRSVHKDSTYMYTLACTETQHPTNRRKDRKDRKNKRLLQENHHSGTKLRTTRLAVLQTCVVDSVYSTCRAFPRVELIRGCLV